MRISFCLPDAPELPSTLTERAQRLLLALNAEIATDVLLETLKLVDYHVCCMDCDLKREGGSCTVSHSVHGLQQGPSHKHCQNWAQGWCA